MWIKLCLSPGGAPGPGAPGPGGPGGPKYIKMYIILIKIDNHEDR